MRRAGVEWAGADGGIASALPDGRVMWFFGDTLSGRIRSDGSLEPGWDFPRNSAVLQTGACFRPLMGGGPDNRTDLIPAPAGQWHWPTTAVVEGNQLRVFMFRMTTNSNEPPWNFQPVDMRIATFSLPSLTLVGTSAIPNGVPSGVGHEWGTSAVTGPDGFVYIYGREGNQPSQDCDPTRERRVARVPLGSVTTGPWQFWDGTGWSSEHTAAALLQFVADTPLPTTACTAKPLDSLNVVPNPSGGYIAGGKLGEHPPPNSLFGTEISKWTAATPVGPWHYGGKIADGVAQSNQFTYGAHLRFNLPGNTPTVLFSANSFDSVENNIWLYGVYFRSPSNL